MAGAGEESGGSPTLGKTINAAIKTAIVRMISEGLRRDSNGFLRPI
jgi:hypothetical protein